MRGNARKSVSGLPNFLSKNLHNFAFFVIFLKPLQKVKNQRAPFKHIVIQGDAISLSRPCPVLKWRRFSPATIICNFIDASVMEFCEWQQKEIHPLTPLTLDKTILW